MSKAKKKVRQRRDTPPKSLPLFFDKHPVDPSIPVEHRNLMQMLPDERGPGGWQLYNPKYCRYVIEHLAMGYSIHSFGGRILIGESTIKYWIEHKEEFGQAVEIGRSLHKFFLEDKALKNLNEKSFNSNLWKMIRDYSFPEEAKETKIEVKISEDLKRVENMSDAELIALANSAVKFLDNKNAIEGEVLDVEGVSHD